MSKFRKRWGRRLFPIKKRAYSTRNTLLSILATRPITAYWYPEKNFGDQLTPDILRSYGFSPLFAPTVGTCEVVCTGSILELTPEDYQGTILGTGFLLPETARGFPKARVLSVRGRLTARKLSLPESTRLGDPGILVNRVYGDLISGISKKHTLGFVPHYLDFESPLLSELCGRYKQDVHVIDVRRKPAEVVRKIASCNHILSSSLHGLVVSHSLGIPCCPIHLTGKLRGGEFKFRDYYSAYDTVPEFKRITGCESLSELLECTSSIDPDQIDFVKNEAHTSFLELADTYK